MYRGESVDLEYEAAENVTSLTLYATNVEPNPEKAPGIIYKFSKQYRKTDNKFTTTLQLLPTYALGRWEFQLVSNLGRSRKKNCCENGTFTILPNLAERQSDPTTQDTGYLSTNERKLREVEDAIHQYIKFGKQSWTISGDQTQVLGIRNLYMERNRLYDLVNIERRERGLPFLPGTQPAITYQTLVY